MKRLISFIVVALGSILITQAQAKLSADEIIKEACEKAAKEDKKVFVMFHASWCGWCHRMDASMNDEDVKKYFDDNFVIRHFVVDENGPRKDLETPGANEIRTRYHGDGQGIPFWLIFDSKGNMVADSKMRQKGEGPEKGQNTGCPAAEAEVAYFIDVLKRTTKLKPDQLEKISKRFRKNEM